MAFWDEKIHPQCSRPSSSHRGVDSEARDGHACQRLPHEDVNPGFSHRRAALSGVVCSVGLVYGISTDVRDADTVCRPTREKREGFIFGVSGVLLTQGHLA